MIATLFASEHGPITRVAPDPLRGANDCALRVFVHPGPLPSQRLYLFLGQADAERLSANVVGLCWPLLGGTDVVGWRYPNYGKQ